MNGEIFQDAFCYHIETKLSQLIGVFCPILSFLRAMNGEIFQDAL